MMTKTLLVILFCSSMLVSFQTDEAVPYTTVKFPSQDELAITADLYKIDETKPIILLCHQAGYSRGEYREIAVKLNKLGFNCLAMDQRSGSKVNGVDNETARGAMKAKLAMQYGDAEQDIRAAIAYLYHRWEKPVIIWGSSYSAALVLKIGKEDDQVAAILAFSPGEYIEGTNIKEAATGIIKPLFVTSSKNEGPAVADLISGVVGDRKVQFIPQSKGKHGSKALWTSSEGHGKYWTVVEMFLSKIQ
ncbi:MAG: alpha/beta hydrolase [Flavobacteriales bacterium]|nr:alpha/beta hydrolase [Flavobacteriales bacterium]